MNFKMLLLALLTLCGCNDLGTPMLNEDAMPAITSDGAVTATVEDLARRRPPHNSAASHDTKTALQHMQDACTVGQAGWACGGTIPKPAVKLTATNSAPQSPPASWSVPRWFVDDANATSCASDSNTCTSAACGSAGSGIGPCLHKAQIGQRWTTWAPILSVDVTVTFLSNDPDGSDPWIATPVIKGGSLLLEGQLPAPSFTGTLLSVTAKVTGSSPGNTLKSTFTAATGAIASEMLLVNTTHPSRALAQRDTGGGNWQISQPLTVYSPPEFYSPTEVNTWANGDVITGYVPVASTVPSAIGSVAQFGAGSPISVWQLTLGSQFEVTNAGSADSTVIADCVEKSSLTIQGTSTFGVEMANLYIDSAAQLTIPPAGSGGINSNAIQGGVLSGFSAMQVVALGTDVILASSNTFCTSCFLTNTFVDTGDTLITSGNTQLSATAGQNVLYGPGGLAVQQGTFNVATSAATNLRVAALSIAAAPTAYSFATSAGVTTVHGGITITAAHIDAAAGAAGFGGIAWGAGAVIKVGSAQP